MQVWILMKGESEEGGDVIGVYADEKTGLAAFTAKVKETRAQLVDSYDTREAGHYACADRDWLQLEPHEVRAT